MWYQKAGRYYAYLADILSINDLSKSEWLQRGWTFQELIAPRSLHFFSQAWTDLAEKMSCKYSRLRYENIRGLSGVRAGDGSIKHRAKNVMGL